MHPEDRERILKVVADARENRKPFIAELRLVRSDRIVRWISARGKFYYDRHGDAERMLGMAVDITDRKQVEEDLASLSGRLISAQEEERKRIAREIHDDYSQHLALLAMDLENLEEEIENPSANEKITPNLEWDRRGRRRPAFFVTPPAFFHFGHSRSGCRGEGFLYRVRGATGNTGRFCR